MIDHLLLSSEHDQKIQISPRDLKDELDQADEEIKLLDIRSREEVEAVKIEGSQIMTNELQQEALGKWNKEKEQLLLIILAKDL